VVQPECFWVPEDCAEAIQQRNAFVFSKNKVVSQGALLGWLRIGGVGVNGGRMLRMRYW